MEGAHAPPEEAGHDRMNTNTVYGNCTGDHCYREVACLFSLAFLAGLTLLATLSLWQMHVTHVLHEVIMSFEGYLAWLADKIVHVHGVVTCPSYIQLSFVLLLVFL